MIPQDLKNAIDKYKNRIPTDEELTALFDTINATKLKHGEPEKVFAYLQTVLDEAEKSCKAKAEKAAKEKAEEEAIVAQKAKEQKRKNEEKIRRKIEEEHKKFVKWRLTFFSLLALLFILIVVFYVYGVNMYIAIPVMAILFAGVMVYLED